MQLAARRTARIIVMRFLRDTRLVRRMRCCLLNCDCDKCTTPTGWAVAVTVGRIPCAEHVRRAVFLVALRRCATAVISAAIIIRRIDIQLIIIGQRDILIVFRLQQIGRAQFDGVVVARRVDLRANGVIFRGLLALRGVGNGYHVNGIIIVSLSMTTSH